MKNFNLPKLETNSQLHFLTIDHVKEALLRNDYDTLNQIFYLFVSRDLKIAEAFEKRKDKLLSLEYEVTPHPLLEHININELIKSLSDSIYYGLAVVDVRWQVKENLLIPTKFQRLHPLAVRRWDNTVDEYFYILEKFSLKEIRLEDIQEQLIFHNHTKSEHIHTECLAYKVVFYAILKHTAIVYNMQFFDSLAIPPLIVKGENLDSEETLQDLVSELSRLKSNSFGVFDKNIDIDTLTKGSSNQTDFLSLIKYFDNLIAQFLTGMGEASEGSKGGSNALAQTSQTRLQEKTKSDAVNLEQTINEFLNRYISLNEANPKKVSFKFLFEDKAKPKKELNSLNHTAKKPLSLQEVQFNKLDSTPIKEELNKAYKILQDSNSYEEAILRVEQYDNPELQKALESLIFNSSLMGEID